MKRVLVFLLGSLFGLTLLGIASASRPPDPAGEWERYISTQSTAGYRLVVGATSSCVPRSTPESLDGGATTGSDGNVCRLYAWEASVRISQCTTETVFCWAMDFNDASVAFSGALTDSGGVSSSAEMPANCFAVGVGEIVEDRVKRHLFAERTNGSYAPGSSWDGFCSGSTEPDRDDWPCRNDAGCEDTTEYCDMGWTAKPYNRTRGAFLLKISAADGTCFHSSGR